MALEHLKELMVRKGIKQVQLAQLLGRDKSAITNLFQGKRQLKASEVVKIAEFLNVSESEVLGKKQSSVLAMGDSGGTEFVVAPSATAAHSSESLSDMYRVSDNAMNLSGVLQGDEISYYQTSNVKSGMVVLVEFADGDSSVTSLRKYQPPFLMPHSSEAHHPQLHEDRASVKIIGIVKKLVRCYD